tara:strand:- start:143 stop:313 length:171 start_codon:yes stop_codon:yes gene_type:complete
VNCCHSTLRRGNKKVFFIYVRGSSEINLHRERVGILEKRLGVGKGKDDLVLKSKLR